MYALTLHHTTNTLLKQGNHRGKWVNNEYLILKGIMKKKQKHNIELEHSYNKTLELPSLRDSPIFPCVIITPTTTAYEEDCRIETTNSANEPTDIPLLHLTCQPEPKTSTTLRNPEHIASPVQETNYNKDIFMIELKYLSPNKNSKSLVRIHKTGNKHQTNINKKRKTTKPKKATVTIEIL